VPEALARSALGAKEERNTDISAWSKYMKTALNLGFQTLNLLLDFEELG
jgi:hypothetical protein